ncbi:hypothetical protein PI126_g2513 [Phytophthora idaei]|nr:hypothetical protein PI126_g2513 [Phytophthora idaei]
MIRPGCPYKKRSADRLVHELLRGRRVLRDAPVHLRRRRGELPVLRLRHLSVDEAVNSTRVDCYGNDRAETAALFADSDAPYVLLEQYTPANTCDNYSNSQTFYADGLCRALPNATTYGSAITSVNEDLSVKLQLFSDAACTEMESNYSVASGDVQWTCFVGYTSDYGLVFYTSASKTYSSTSGDGNGSTTGSDFTIVHVGSSSSGSEATATSEPATSVSNDGSSSSVGAGVIAAIVVGCVVVLALIAGLIWWRKRRERVNEGSQRGNKDAVQRNCQKESE